MKNYLQFVRRPRWEYPWMMLQGAVIPSFVLAVAKKDTKKYLTDYNNLLLFGRNQK